MSTKRKKLIWDVDTVWSSLPTVILATSIRELKWFTGHAEYHENMTNESTKKLFDNGFTKKKQNSKQEGPRDLHVYLSHKKKSIEVYVEWDESLKRFSIYLALPYSKKYSPNTHQGSPKKVHSRYLEGVLERIKEAFDCAIIVINEDAEEEKMLKEKKQENVDYRDRLGDELEVVLTSPLYCDSYSEYQYGKGRKYGIRFEKINTDNDEDEFAIRSIKGVFGKEEIKQLIKIVGGCPRAIASRLIKK